VFRDRLAGPERKTVTASEKRVNRMPRAHSQQPLAINNGEEFEVAVAERFEDMLDAVARADGLAMANKHAQIDRPFGDKLRW
jgi:hypothetical protein